MAQNSCYDNDIKHVLKRFGTSSGSPSKRGVKTRLVQYCPKAMLSVIDVMTAPEARVKGLRNSGGD